MIQKRCIYWVISLVFVLLCGCIENDLPYPVVLGEIKAIEAEGFVASSINKENREVLLTVADTIDLSNIRITKFEVSDGVLIIPDSSACKDVTHFPDSGFVSVDSLPSVVNTYINILKPVTFTLRTYQDYSWKITAKPDIQRVFKLNDNKGKSVVIGTPLIDELNRQVIVYVDEYTDLKNLIVDEIRFGSSIAITKPEPSSITDFSRSRKFKVTTFGVEEEWVLNVIAGGVQGVKLIPWAKRAYITGAAKEGTVIDIKYRKQGLEEWDQVFDDEVSFQDGNFTAVLRHLSPGTTYEYQATIGSQKNDLKTFVTDTMAVLPNSGFENWLMYKNETLNPPMTAWAVFGEGEDMFWDTGNWGSATLSKYITVADESSCHGGKRSAKLQSQFVGLMGAGKFAAGNLFIGQYIKTDGMDGILDFGRPFEGYPSALKGWLKFKTAKINNVAKEPLEADDAQLGVNDKATIYIALGDWDKPVRIKTKMSERQLFDKNDPNIIAYQEMELSESVIEWTEFKLKLDYRSLERKPKYIIIVCSASKYGDYFTGGDGSTLWVDDFELIYE